MIPLHINLHLDLIRKVVMCCARQRVQRNGHAAIAVTCRAGMRSWMSRAATAESVCLELRGRLAQVEDHAAAQDLREDEREERVDVLDVRV